MGWTTIKFNLPHRSYVKLLIYNILGQGIITLIDRIIEAGTFVASWDGTDKYGRTVPSGINLYKLQTDGFQK